MDSLFEAIMVICFGLSWPLSVYKSWKSRTTKGKSLLFEVCIWFGYLSGIVGKFVSDKVTWVVIIYIINIFMVSIDIILYMRNRILDRETAAD